MKKKRQQIRQIQRYGSLALILLALPAIGLAQEAPDFVETGNPVLNYSQKMARQIAGETAPVFEEEEPSLDFPRNPFEVSKKQKLMLSNYGKIVEGFFLRGIIKVGDRQLGLFEINEKGEGGKILRRVEVGDELRVNVGETEAVFTVVELGDRRAVVRGENNTEYKVWL